MNRNVYLVQRPAFYDRKKKGWVNKYDFSAAREFGEFVVLLPPGNIFGSRFEDSLKRLRDGLKNYDPDKDHILAAGDPVAIAAAVLLAGKSRRVSLLRYDRRDDRYIPHMVTTDDNPKIKPGRTGDHR